MKCSGNLRFGYTTGACAAAASKAAAVLLLQCRLGDVVNKDPAFIEIPFPDGSRVRFNIYRSGFDPAQGSAWASVIKDAGDDPDVTNGAEIISEVRIIGSGGKGQRPLNGESEKTALPIFFKGGGGVGRITKPGLSLPVGEPAINPIPRKMIQKAIMEELKNRSLVIDPGSNQRLEVAISVTNGEELAKKTLNFRLGILGGISILGTTGIVSPLSAEAWTSSITSAMDVTRAMGHDEVVISSGRTSEKAHMNKFNLPEEAYVMMGDYLEFSLLEAGKHGFRKIHLCAQWAKMLKIALATPQTHVRHGAINVKQAVKLLEKLWQGHDRRVDEIWKGGAEFNTAREIFDMVSTLGNDRSGLLRSVCLAAKDYAAKIAGDIPLTSHLVSYAGEILADSDNEK